MDRPHILVIEDDASVCELLYACLDKAAYRVNVAQTGESGLTMLEEDRPDLVVLDLTLPGMSGLDVCRSMRQDPWMSKMPVLMLTGRAEEDDIVTGLEIGADDYMTKPFTAKVLRARVQALLRRGRSAGARSNEADDGKKGTAGQPQVAPLLINSLGQCEILLGERRLSWADQFSPSQRQLLAMLLATPTGKLPQEDVQLALWPDSPTAKARSSFDSLLSRVRRSLEQALAPIDSRSYLVVRRGILCLENIQVDAHEFRRQARKGLQQFASGQAWPAEITLSSAFSLWQGRFLPGDFGSEAASLYQDELEQLHIEASMVLARILAEGARYQEAGKLLRHAQRYEPTNDALVRLLYQLYLAQGNHGQAHQVLQQYQDVMRQENFSTKDFETVLLEFPQAPPENGWLAGA
jgi:DNA-binding response OmpR family regulator